jgi:hypothetical protein
MALTNRSDTDNPKPHHSLGLSLQCTWGTVESDSPRRTCRLYARRQVRQPAGLGGAQGVSTCLSPGPVMHLVMQCRVA